MASVAERVEIAYLEPHGLGPEVKVIAAERRNIHHNEREGGRHNEDVAAGCMAADGLLGRVENVVVIAPDSCFRACLVRISQV